MLTEWKDVRQVPGQRRRRCFTDKTFELMLWLETDGSLYGFQLIYALPSRPLMAVTWTKDEGALFHEVHGGDRAGAGGWDAGRTLGAASIDEFDKPAVLEAFEASAGELPGEYYVFVRRQLVDHPRG